MRLEWSKGRVREGRRSRNQGIGLAFLVTGTGYTHCLMRGCYETTMQRSHLEVKMIFDNRVKLVSPLPHYRGKWYLSELPVPPKVQKRPRPIKSAEKSTRTPEPKGEKPQL